jgi:hypothetical protein
MFVLLGFLCIFLRCGIHPGGGVDMMLPSLLQFPKPISVMSEDIFPLAILKLSHVHTQIQWTLFFLVLTLTAAASILWLISGKDNKWRNLLFVAFVFSPVTFELFNTVGTVDLFTILGWLFFLNRRSKYLWILGIIMVAFTNTPQVPFSVVMIFLFYVAKPISWLKTRLMVLCLVSIPGYLMIEIWLRSNKAYGFLEPGQGLISWPHILQSGYQFFVHLPNSFFSCYGIFWAPIILFIFSYNGHSRILMLISLLIIPLFFAIIVEDATRVFTNLTFAIAYLAIESYFNSFSSENLQKQEQLWILFACFFPLNWYGAGLFHKPFTGYLGIFRDLTLNTSHCLGAKLTSLQRDACQVLNSFR